MSTPTKQLAAALARTQRAAPQVCQLTDKEMRANSKLFGTPFSNEELTDLMKGHIRIACSTANLKPAHGAARFSDPAHSPGVTSITLESSSSFDTSYSGVNKLREAYHDLSVFLAREVERMGLALDGRPAYMRVQQLRENFTPSMPYDIGLTLHSSADGEAAIAIVWKRDANSKFSLSLYCGKKAHVSNLMRDLSELGVPERVSKLFYTDPSMPDEEFGGPPPSMFSGPL